jgi:hypothetical protein
LGLREVTTPMDSSDCCAICLQDLDSHHAHPDPAAETPALRLRAMPCSHTFHQRCIFEWLRRNAVCPFCRHQLPTEEEEEDEEQEQEQDQDQGRRSRSRVVYNEEDGQNYIHWHYREQPVAGEEQELDDEQERRTATLREGLARWRNTVRSTSGGPHHKASLHGHISFSLCCLISTPHRRTGVVS